MARDASSRRITRVRGGFISLPGGPEARHRLLKRLALGSGICGCSGRRSACIITSSPHDGLGRAGTGNETRWRPSTPIFPPPSVDAAIAGRLDGQLMDRLACEMPQVSILICGLCCPGRMAPERWSLFRQGSRITTRACEMGAHSRPPAYNCPCECPSCIIGLESLIPVEFLAVRGSALCSKLTNYMT